MITLPWHFFVMLVVWMFLLYKLLSIDGSGDYNFGAGIESILYLLAIIFSIVIYGGIFWW